MIDKKDILGILSAVEQTAHYTKEYSEYEIGIVHNTIETIRIFIQCYPEKGINQIPDAPPYKIGDEDYRDRVTCGVNASKDEWWYYDSHLI